MRQIAAALALKIRVVPVLVDGARMPNADRLPEPIRPLVRRNAVEIRNTNFGRDADALVDKIREALKSSDPGMPTVRRTAPAKWIVAGAGAVALLLVIRIVLDRDGVPKNNAIKVSQRSLSRAMRRRPARQPG